MESRGVSKNRERLLTRDRESFFHECWTCQAYMSDEHFTVDGTLIEAWASHKSFRRRTARGSRPDRERGGLSRGEAQEPDHESTTDRDARLFKKSKGSEAKLGYLGHVLMRTATVFWCKLF